MVTGIWQNLRQSLAGCERLFTPPAVAYRNKWLLHRTAGINLTHIKYHLGSTFVCLFSRDINIHTTTISTISNSLSLFLPNVNEISQAFMQLELKTPQFSEPDIGPLLSEWGIPLKNVICVQGLGTQQDCLLLLDQTKNHGHLNSLSRGFHSNSSQAPFTWKYCKRKNCAKLILQCL